jgi:hypothetical protein
MKRTNSGNQTQTSKQIHSQANQRKSGKEEQWMGNSLNGLSFAVEQNIPSD